jgi:hypothetical protein
MVACLDLNSAVARAVLANLRVVGQPVTSAGTVSHIHRALRKAPAVAVQVFRTD